MKHPLHRKVGECLKELEKLDGKYEVLLSSECGGQNDIPFYLEEGKTLSERNICNVDAVIIDRNNSQIVAVVEIEESNVSPVNLCGKLIATALAQCCIYRERSYCLRNLLLLHILKAPEKGVKKKQVENLMKRLNNSGLFSLGLSVSAYKVIWEDEKLCDKIKQMFSCYTQR